MPYIAWTDNLSVGVETLDSQHKVLVKTLNDLHSAMVKGQARSIVSGLLKTLVRYTREHFGEEERLMAEAGYPDLAPHRMKHRELTRQVEEYLDRYEKGDAALTIDLLDFLSKWLTGHIQGDDQKYSACLNNGGVR